MKRGEPFNVLRDWNSWSNVPRDPATIAVSAIGYAQGAGILGAVGPTFVKVATLAVSLGLSVATNAIISALTPAPPTPKQSILVNARDAAGPQEFVYGETRKGGTITYLETTRGGSVLYQIIALAAHEIESVEAIYINDEVATLSDDSYSNSRRSGAGWVTNRTWSDDPDEHEIRIFYHLGDQTAITDTFANSSTESLDSVFFDTGSADEDSQNFGGVGQPTKASFVGNGIAYLFVRFGYASSVFQNGIPVITAQIKGKKVFDPRTSTTAYSNNAALCIRDFLTSSYGLNDPEIDDTVFAAAANTCDEDVTLDAGGTEKRYTMNGVVRADQTYGDVIQQMVTSCGGTLFWGAGKWKLAVAEYNAPTKTLTLDDLRSNISLQTRINLRDQFNKVQGVFNDASNRFIATDYPPIESATFVAQDNGVEQALDLDLPFTTSSATAQRLAKMMLFRGREQMVFQAEFSLNALDVEIVENVALTIPRYGWTAKEFEVVNWRFFIGGEGDLRVALSLRETSEDAFAWDAEETAIIGNDSSLSVDPEPVSNLTASAYGVISADGTFTNGILVDWDSSPSAGNYELEWTVNDSIDYAANGGIVAEASAVTTREQFIYKGYIEILFRQPDQDGFDFYNTGGGSGLDEEAFRAQLLASPERNTVKFAGITVREPTTQYVIKPVLDGIIYNIRVRAFNTFDQKSEWRSVTFTTSVKDGTIPNAPTGLTAAAGYGTIKLGWNAVTTNTDSSTANDIFLYNIYRGTSSNPTTLVDTTAGTGWSDVSLTDSTTYYYRIKAVDFSGNESAYSAQASATTSAAVTDGANGDRTYTGRVYYNTLLSSTPGTINETGVTFNESTGEFTGGTFSATPSGWRHTQPKVEVSSLSLLEWSAPYTVTVSGDLSYPQTSVPNTSFSFGTPSGAAQIATDLESDNFSLTPGAEAGWKLERDTGNLYANDGIFRGQLVAGEVNIISGSRSALIDPEGTFEVVDIAGTGTATVGRFVQVSATSTGDVLEIRKEGSSGRGLFVDCRSTATDGVFVQMDNSSTTGDGIHIKQDGSGNGLYIDHNNASGQALEISASNDGIYVLANDRGIYSETIGTSTGDDAGWFENSGTGGGWIILGRSSSNAGWAFDAPAGDGRLQSGTYTPFTGSHDALFDRVDSISEGDIVCDGDVVYNSISDSITKVVKSSYANDPSCIGVFKKEITSWDLPLLGDDGSLEANYKHIQVNAVGEGGINVCGEGGNISKGDLIVTSSTPGKGMKQADDIVRSYTVAKAREDVTFSGPDDIKMIACIYLCG